MKDPAVRFPRAVLCAGALAILPVVVGCRSAREPGGDGETATAREACFNVRRVDSFAPLHERYVYVRVGNDEHYLLTLDRPYIGLQSAAGIAIVGDFSRICSDTGASLSFGEFGQPVLCRIVRVEAVPYREEAERLVYRRTQPAPR